MGEWATGRGLTVIGSNYLQSAVDLLYDVEEKARRRWKHAAIGRRAATYSGRRFLSQVPNTKRSLYRIQKSVLMCAAVGVQGPAILRRFPSPWVIALVDA